MTGRKVTGKVSPPASAVVHFYPIDGFPSKAARVRRLRTPELPEGPRTAPPRSPRRR
jgi:hypothetical protein